MDVTIRTMTDADVPAVCEVLRAAFTWIADGEGFNDRQREFLLGQRSSEATVREEARNRPHLVACLDGVVVGMAVVKGNEVARLYVHPACHRRGIGRALFDAAVEVIRAAGHTEATVAALVESAARFYRAMGMAEVGRVVYEPEIFLGREVVLLSKPV